MDLHGTPKTDQKDDDNNKTNTKKGVLQYSGDMFSAGKMLKDTKLTKGL